AAQTIQGALGALDVTGPHTITVTGTCNEAVNIGNRERVTIDGGGTTVINATGTGASAINVGGAKKIKSSGVERTAGAFSRRVAPGRGSWRAIGGRTTTSSPAFVWWITRSCACPRRPWTTMAPPASASTAASSRSTAR